MKIKHLKDCPPFKAGDGCELRELANAATEKRAFRYSLAHAIVAPGQKTMPHRLRTSEVYYILQGNGVMHIDQETFLITAGDMVDIPPMASQWIENTSGDDLVFLCIVDPGWRKEDEIVGKE
jgi:mannose-6-phosphate isomerase-like protein (cupin superfamily)